MNHFRSLSLRLALYYLILFTASVLLLGLAWWWFTIRTSVHEARLRVEREMAHLAAVHQTQGSGQLMRELEQRASRPSGRMPFHALIAANGSLLSANLPSWPREHRDGWLRIDADLHAEGDKVDHEALSLDRILPDGSRLIVGRDIENIDEIEEKLLAAVSGLLLGTLILGVAGGFLMNRAIGWRIAAVSRTARQVIDGDFSGRIPLRGSSDDFDRLSATLNDMLDRTEQMFDSVRRVSDNVAHELRTPLARLRASLEQLRDSHGNQPAATLDEAIEEAAALEKTFEAVLRIARIESGRHRTGMAPVDMSAVMADAAELYHPLAEERGQSFEVDIQPGLVVSGDRDLLFQSICNLLDNAIKYTPPGGRIRLAGRRGNGQAEIAIVDDGPGVAVEHRERITERFYRVPATSGERGAGLGLSLVAAVAERHESSLALEDAAPGLRVLWTLPAKD